jgi:hypothetical protein
VSRWPNNDGTFKVDDQIIFVQAGTHAEPFPE